jgi:hypothetical protein
LRGEEEVVLTGLMGLFYLIEEEEGEEEEEDANNKGL